VHHTEIGQAMSALGSTTEPGGGVPEGRLSIY